MVIIIFLFIIIICVLLTLIIINNNLEDFSIEYPIIITGNGNGNIILKNVENNDTYNYYMFTKGETIFNLKKLLVCDLLIIGGGGSGGSGGNDGYGGEVNYYKNIKLRPNKYIINVGNGGSPVELKDHNKYNGIDGSDSLIIFNSMILYKGKGGKGAIGSVTKTNAIIIEKLNVFSLNDIGFPNYDNNSRNNIIFNEDTTEEIIPDKTPIKSINITGKYIDYGDNGGKGLIYNENNSNNITGGGGNGLVIIRFNKDFIKLQEIEENDNRVEIIKKNL